MAEHDYDDLSKEQLVDEIKKRNGDKSVGDEGYIPTSGNKEELASRLKDDDAGDSTSDASAGVDTSSDDDATDKANPTGGTGGGASGQPDPDEDDEVEGDGQPATAEATQLLLNEQHGASPEVVEQSEEIEQSLEERRDEAKSNVSAVSDEEAKAVYDHNTGVPLWRRNTEDLTDEQKKAPSDYPTPQGDGAAPYSEEHQAAADAEREKKNATLPKFDDRDEYDDTVPIGDNMKTERLGESGRGDILRSDESDTKPYVGGGEQHIYTAPEDTTWREIATLLGLPRPEEIAHINGRYDGTAHVAKGTEVLLPDGYDYQ